MSLSLFAVCAPGLEAGLAHELQQLKLTPRAPENAWGNLEGGVAFEGALKDLYRANLHLRTASRIVVRIGEFSAVSFAELRRKASRLEWERFIRPGQALTVKATCHKSKLYHSDAVAERVVGAIEDHLGRTAEISENTQTVLVRLVRDQCVLSLDSSGELLHQRGYRLATGKAPLRETLAAGLLLHAGWDGSTPLLDPFCGSGTIAIEAALLAGKRAPGVSREFAFMRWPSFNRAVWETGVSAARAKECAVTVPIYASDRDAGAIEAARANAHRAGIAESLSLACHAISNIEPPPGPGWVITNPPYGARVSEGKELRNLYAQLGKVLRQKCAGWQVALLYTDPALLAQTGIKFDGARQLKLNNGGLKVTLAVGRVAAH